MEKELIRREFGNLLASAIRNPHKLFSAVAFYTRLGLVTIRKRVSNSAVLNYPERALFMTKLDIFAILPFAETAKERFGIQFRLKTSMIDESYGENDSWDIVIETHSAGDPEVLNSIHRWYWLVYDKRFMEHMPVKEVLHLLKIWIHQFPCHASDLAWHPYNVSERVSCLCQFVLARNSFDTVVNMIKNDPEIFSFLQQSVKHLSKNLEYYPQGVTYNHVVNDLKGILTAAMLCDDNNILVKSADLFFDELNLIVNEGELREGSSHYQLIVTRWVCELEYLFKVAGLGAFQERLRSFSVMMLRQCYFYFVQDEGDGRYNIPLIGDISPDFDPRWMVDYFNVSDALSSSGAVYGNRILRDLKHSHIMQEVIAANSVVQGTKNRTKIRLGDWTVFICHTPASPDFFPGHAHDDYASYIIFLFGKQLVCDTGRSNYLRLPTSIPYSFAEFHNVLGIEELPILPSESLRYYLPPFFRESNTGLNIIQTENKVEMKLETDALNRFVKDGQYQRIFRITNDEIIIQDNLSGHGKPVFALKNRIAIDSNYKLGELLNKKIMLTVAGGVDSVILSAEGQVDIRSIYQSRRYGHEEESFQLVFSQKSSFPLSQTFGFKKNIVCAG